MRRAVVVIVIVASLGARVSSAEVEEPSLIREGALGMGAAVASFAYSPLKVAYAVGGIVLGGLSFVWTWGDRDIAGTVMRTALAGDYVVTPEHLDGDADLEFSGD